MLIVHVCCFFFYTEIAEENQNNLPYLLYFLYSLNLRKDQERTFCLLEVIPRILHQKFPISLF